MNPERAYVAHTDWARAASRDGTDHHDWFAARIRHHCRPVGPVASAAAGGNPGQGYRQFLTGEGSDQDRLRIGPIVTTNIVVAADPSNTPDQTDPAGLDGVGLHPPDVFAADIEEPAPGSVKAQAVLVPEPVYAQGTLDMLAGAPTYYVSADMVTVMEVAAAAFDQFDLMPRMPTETGFVVLARPIEVPDYDGVQQVAAFAWTSWGDINTTMDVPGRVGDIWTFSSRSSLSSGTTSNDPVVVEAHEQWSSKTAWRHAPDLLPGYADRYVVGERVGPVVEDICISQARTKVAQMTQAAWKGERDNQGDPVAPEVDEWVRHVTAWGARTDQELARLHEEHDGPRLVGRTQPYLAAFVLLLTQQITHEESRPVSDDAVRLGRAVARSRPSRVTVVDVRRSARRSLDADPDELDDRGTRSESRKGLDHRHLVGSHWKWQPYGPERSLRRRIFVTGYVRGPEDKPLRVQPRVTRLS